MGKTIDFDFDKKVAIKLAKKAVSSKFAILKDDGDSFKVGAPMMTATFSFTDKSVDISGSSMVVTTCASAVEDAFDDYKSSNSNPAVSSWPAVAAPIAAAQPRSEDSNLFDDLLIKTKLLNEYYLLHKNKVITAEDFAAIKETLLKEISVEKLKTICSPDINQEGQQTETVGVAESLSQEQHNQTAQSQSNETLKISNRDKKISKDSADKKGEIGVQNTNDEADCRGRQCKLNKEIAGEPEGTEALIVDSNLTEYYLHFKDGRSFYVRKKSVDLI